MRRKEIRIDHVDTEKRYIYFTRDYRYFNKPGFTNIVYICLTVLPVVALVLMFYPEISMAISNWVSGVISQATGVQTGLASSEYIPSLGDVFFVDMSGTSPTASFALINLVVSLLSIVFITRLQSQARSFIIFVNMAMFVHAVASAFFLLWPEYFPYILTDYSELYMEQQISLWIMIPIIAGFATGMIRAPLPAKLLAFYTTLAFSFVFGVCRYVVYMAALNWLTALYMATLFFTLGVLFDFMQVVCVYSVFVKYASSYIGSSKEAKIWQWS